MNKPRTNLTVRFDATNPGHFFACCGLFELAHRIWSEVNVEAYFDDKGYFHLTPLTPQNGLELLEAVKTCTIEGLSAEERVERKSLEKKRKQGLTKHEEARLKELGTKARSGKLHFGEPFSLLLDWWQTEDERTPKTWAGKQEIHKVASSLQDSLREVNEIEPLFEFACVPRQTAEYRGDSKNKQAKKVVPFCFDARLFVHSLDVGFSLDVQDVERHAYPAVELLALIGLQRFRPLNHEQGFDYWLWMCPLPIAIAAAVACGAVKIEASSRYRFNLLFRDDKRRYKAFRRADLIQER